MKKIAHHVIGGVMVANFLTASFLAFVFDNLLGYFIAYACVGPILHHLGVINHSWFDEQCGGKYSKRFRAMTLWPITVMESRKHQKLMQRIADLIYVLEQMPPEEKHSSDEWKELMSIHTKMVKNQNGYK